MWSRALVLCLFAGCIEPDLVVCDNGLACPAILRCDLAHRGCVTQDQLDGCRDRPDLAPCGTTRFGDGICHDGVCFANVCGNGFVDPGEECDDGNTDSRDGCAADCKSNETCGNGVIDPQLGESCDDGNRDDGDGCEADCHVAICGDGIVDPTAHELCDAGPANSDVDGHCRTNCTPARCGDAIVDATLGEVCDDGNLVPGDGCSPDCRSLERCGNGILDFARGETCDDGNLRSHDGCDSRCGIEAAVWTSMNQIGNPAFSRGVGAYDEARHRLVVVTGLAADGTNRTLEWDGVTWIDREPLVAPPARNDAAMVYDAAHHVMVLFGGSNTQQDYGDTWLWDGEHWTDVTPPGSPSLRPGAAMAYDAARKRVLLVGGSAIAITETDTWSWDGRTWTQLTPTTSPPRRGYASMVFDPKAGNVVLYGGRQPLNMGWFDDTWLWNGFDWAQADLGGVPGGREAASMSYDPIWGVVLSGGLVASSSFPDLMFHWTGAVWVGVSTPGPRTSGVSFFDRELGQTVLAGGQIGGVQTTTMWSMNELDPQGGGAGSPNGSIGPTDRRGAGLAYDARRGRIVMFGGTDAAFTIHNETWELVDGTWRPPSQVIAPPIPSPRLEPGMTYDPVRQVVVMFGGDAADPDVWEWNGTAWLRRSSGTAAPDPRDSTILVYDDADHAAVMFAGNQSQTTYNDTWTWNGTAWTDRTATPAPEFRFWHGMTYDFLRGNLVMFGGGAEGFFGDTWTWTLAGGWVQRFPAVSASARYLHAMTYDRVRDEALMFGGTYDGTHALGDLWRWNGSWSRVNASQPPTPRFDVALVYDAAREQTMLYGTIDSARATYRLRWESSTPSDACATAVDLDGDGLAGCADPDCAAYCATCGNGVVDPLETCRSCPTDVGPCPARCGDTYCDAPETVLTCPGDCTP